MRDLAARDASAPTVRLRRATLADVDAIAAIERLAFSDPWSRDSFATLARNGDVFFLVADAGSAPGASAPVGYLVAWYVLDEGEVANIAVAPSARGTGVGARLLDAALAEGRRRGVGHMFLEVRESNAVARRLYASRGFIELGRRKRYYREPVEDALVLRCELAAPRGQDTAGGVERTRRA
ncbi:ribosomal protein S18-alanine N-acetyltransferase [Roseisolibacter agri]|uniref:Ribosomal-protein-alanine acetyltransferase n=1 Tax=Roseisolibacter agri TaxID=2014610 RepID=A0AA37QKN0_9BACT|nr:ribosomal protein S18-alanine N-acetyltransferase [Roseisolibacter agri]GLC27548.1 ribosomal-protein-alanine acetyltransferase [Roseisolibacter agri]